MSGVDLVAAEGILKQRYLDPRYVADVIYPESPIVALVRKDTKAGGKNWKFPLRIGATAGTSNQFGYAQANVTPSKYTAWQCTRAFKYATFTIAGEVMAAAKGNEDSFVDASKWEVDGGLKQAAIGMSCEIYGNGGGSRGVISSASTVSSTSITLATPSDIYKFPPDATLVFAADDGSGASPGGVLPGSAKIVSIDENTGTITFASALSGLVSGVATGNNIFLQGEYANAALGLDAWLLSSAPTPGVLFNGVDRSINSKLWGTYFTGTGNMEETLIKASAILKQRGGKPSHLFVNPIEWATLAQSLTAKTFYAEKGDNERQVGFQAMRFDGPSGPVKILADPYCKQGVGYLLTLDCWELASAGPAPMILDDDKLGVLVRDWNADSYSGRVGAYWNWVCSRGAPSHNSRIVF